MKKTDKSSLCPWSKCPLGAIISEAGGSKKYKTGNWVPKNLKFIPENCINCNLCWGVCPDAAILVDEKGNMIGVNTDHCKNCGLCIQACPTTKNPDRSKHALRMEEAPDPII